MGTVGDATMMISGDWRHPLQRQRIFNKIMDTLKRHLPFSETDRLQELNKIAERVEHEIYTATTTQPEYSRMICFMMLTMETRLQNPIWSNSAANTVNSSVPFDSTAQTGSSNGGDWQEEVHQKLKAMKDLYLQDVTAQTGNPSGQDGQEEVCQKMDVGDEEDDEEGDGDEDEVEEEDEESDSDEDEDEDENDAEHEDRPADYYRWSSYQRLSYDRATREYEEARRRSQKLEMYQRMNMYALELECNRRFAYEEQIRHYHDYHAGLPYIETPPPVDYSTLPRYTPDSSREPYPQSKPSRWLPKHITSSFSSVMDTLKMYLEVSGNEGLQELKKVAVRFEEKIYIAATSQSDYLRKISLKMLTMETRSQNPMPDTEQSTSSANSVNLSDPGVS